MEIDDKKSFSLHIRDYPDVLDVAQACVLLGVCDKTLYKLIREGKLPALRVGRIYRIAKTHIKKLMKIYGGAPGQTSNLEA